MDKVPSLANRISLFTSKPQISRYAAGSITDYCHALYKAVWYISKLPEEFTQEEVDGYLKLLPDRQTLEANCPRNVTSLLKKVYLWHDSKKHSKRTKGMESAATSKAINSPWRKTGRKDYCREHLCARFLAIHLS